MELKIPGSRSAVRDRLEEEHADFLDRVEQADTYYDSPMRDFSDTDEALRIRRVDSETESCSRLTYKGPRIDSASKTREEYETTIEDSGATHEILSSLGFEPVATVRKIRDRYRLEGYLISLDSVEGVGEFIEIETTIADEHELETARNRAADIARRLGLDPADRINRSYLEMLLESEVE